MVHELRERYGDELRVVFRHFPLPDVHPRAVAAALSAEAAADYGWFWEMHDLLYSHQRALGTDDLVGYAESLGLPRSEVTTALSSRRDRLEADVDSGRRSGVRGTPTFFLNGGATRARSSPPR